MTQVIRKSLFYNILRYFFSLLFTSPYPEVNGGIQKYQPTSFGGKNMKRRREKGGKYRRKRKKGKRKGRKGKQNEKRGSKRVK
jgi:hypothetical protein